MRAAGSAGPDAAPPPRHVADLVVQAGVVSRAGDTRETERLLRSIVLEAPHWQAGQIELGLFLIARRRHDEAVAVLQEAVRIDPLSPSGHFVLAASLHNLGRGDLAVAPWRRATALMPADARTYEGLLKAPRRAGVTNSERRMASWTVALAPTSTTALASVQWSWIQAGNWALAQRAGRRLLAVRPASARAMALLLWSLHKSGKGPAALALIGGARALAPADGWVRHTLATILFNNGRFEDAEADVRATLGTGKSSGDSWFLLARVLRAQDRYDEANAAVATAVARDPSFADRRRILNLTVRMEDFVDRAR